MLLEFTAVSQRYGKKTVIDAQSCRFPVGLTLLSGPSGAGKSTLLRLCATQENPSAGEISFDGRPGGAGRHALRRTLGYAPQAVDLPEDLTAREFLLYMAALKGLALSQARRQLLSILQNLGLLADANEKIVAYSGGMRRRLTLAQALLGQPKILIADEPTAELDAATAGLVRGLLSDAAKAAIVIVSTHFADELRDVAVQTLLLADGRITAGSA